MAYVRISWSSRAYLGVCTTSVPPAYNPYQVRIYNRPDLIDTYEYLINVGKGLFSSMINCPVCGYIQQLDPKNGVLALQSMYWPTAVLFLLNCSQETISWMKL